MVICSHCGKELQNTAKFCSACGQRVYNARPAPKQAAYISPDPACEPTSEPIPAATGKKRKKKRKPRPIRLVAMTLFILNSAGNLVMSPILLVAALLTMIIIPLFVVLAMLLAGIIGGIFELVGMSGVAQWLVDSNAVSVLLVVLMLAPGALYLLAGIWRAFMAVFEMVMPWKLPTVILSVLTIIESVPRHIVCGAACGALLLMSSPIVGVIIGVIAGLLLCLVDILPCALLIFAPRKEFKQKETISNV